MKFFATEKIGSKRQTTPEGYLLIEGTPIARTGTQKYLPEELGNKIEPNADGYVDVLRTPEEVFNPISLASFNGKPFTNDHPNDLIGPLTWRDLALGVVMNPRQGADELADHVVADILICDRYAIELIGAGKVELSNGYNAEYFETGPGTAEQRNILGNHVALVSEGRCGPTCAIGDHSKCNGNKEKDMTTKTLRDRLMATLGVKDKAGLETALDKALTDEGAGGLHIHLPGGADSEGEDPMESFGKRMDGMEAALKTCTDYITAKAAEDKAMKDKASKDAAEAEEKRKKEAGEASAEDKETASELEEEAPSGTGDKARIATDSAYLVDAFQASIALGEILVPGFSPPTFDKAAAPKLSLKSICDFRKKVLDAANLTTDGKVIIADLLGGKVLDTAKMSCGQTRQMFFGAAAAKKQLNNNGGRTVDNGQQAKPSKAIRSLADLSRRAEEIYNTKPGAKAN